jgi:hypothetical protein
MKLRGRPAWCVEHGKGVRPEMSCEFYLDTEKIKRLKDGRDNY